jgi:hypothetical protein
VVEWRARNAEHFFTPTLLIFMLIATSVVTIIIFSVAAPAVWLFRIGRLPMAVQIILGIIAAAALGEALIHLDPGFPNRRLALSRYEGVSTGLLCGSIFAFCCARYLRHHPYVPTTGIA